MSFEDYILIVEPDPDVLDLFTTHFTHAENFGFYVARTGKEAFSSALRNRPKLILTETKLPDQSGMSLMQQLQQYPRTAHIPIIFLARGTEIFLQNQTLAAGAYDFVDDPADVAEIGLRIRNALRRIKREGKLHPDTYLPTGDLIYHSLQASKGRTGGCRIDCTLDNFKPFQEKYGFLAAREVIIFLGNIIHEIINEVGISEDFLGHFEDIHFVVITDLAHSFTIQQLIRERLESHLPQFYTYLDRENNDVEVTRADGQVERHPLMSLTIQIEPL